MNNPNTSQNPASPQPTKSTPWFRILVTLLALSLVIFLISKEDWGNIFIKTQKFIGLPLLYSILLTTGSRLFTTLRWHTLLNFKEKRTTFIESAKINFSGLFAANFLPTTIGGDVIRLAGGIKAGLGGSFTTASIIVDRLIGMAGMLLFFPFGLNVVLPLLEAKTNSANSFPALTTFPIIHKVVNKLKESIKPIFSSIALWAKNPASLLRSMFFNLLHIIMLFGVIWIILLSFGEQISFWKAGGLWTFVYIITLLPISINGLGVQELSITYVFVNFGGVDETNALLLALVLRLLFILLSLPGAFFVYDLLPNSFNKNTNN